MNVSGKGNQVVVGGNITNKGRSDLDERSLKVILDNYDRLEVSGQYAALGFYLLRRLCFLPI